KRKQLVGIDRPIGQVQTREQRVGRIELGMTGKVEDINRAAEIEQAPPDGRVAFKCGDAGDMRTKRLHLRWNSREVAAKVGRRGDAEADRGRPSRELSPWIVRGPISNSSARSIGDYKILQEIAPIRARERVKRNRMQDVVRDDQETLHAV